MKVRTAYLDSSVIGELIEQPGDYNRICSEQVVEFAKKGMLVFYTSNMVEVELRGTPMPRLIKILEKWWSIPSIYLTEHREIPELAKFYSDAKILTKRDDVHMAYATIYKADIFLTFNRRTIINKLDRIIDVNKREGHSTPLPVKPTDFISKVKIVGNSLLYAKEDLK